MDTSWYQKKKIWAALITAVGTLVSQLTGNEELANSIMYIGMMLIGGLALEDMGKAKVIEEKKAIQPQINIDAEALKKALTEIQPPVK